MDSFHVKQATGGYRRFAVSYCIIIAKCLKSRATPPPILGWGGESHKPLYHQDANAVMQAIDVANHDMMRGQGNSQGVEPKHE
jgi:hypothetical protein